MCKLNKYQILYSIKTICAKLTLGFILCFFSSAQAADDPVRMDSSSQARTQSKTNKKLKSKSKKKTKKTWKRRYLVSGELGHHLFDPVKTYSRESGLLNKSYLLLKAEYEFEPLPRSIKTNKYILSASVRADYGPEKEEDLSVRSLTATVVNNSYSLDVGIQEIAWGESFGNMILDLINPRDYRDPLLDDPLWQRVPVGALNLKVFSDQTTYQFVLTPIVKNNLYPPRGSFFNPFPDGTPSFQSIKEKKPGEDAEYGSRISHLFENGFDLAFIYYNYLNRNLVFELDANGDLQQVQKRMETFGFSFSQAFDQVVVRSDVAHNVDQMIQYSDLETSKAENLTQTILGFDLSLRDQLTLGIQWQGDFYQKESLQWGSFRIEKSWWDNLLKFEFFVFEGIGNDDFWLQPRITWNANSELTISLSADIIDGSQKSTHTYLNFWSNKSRYLAIMTYRF